MLSMVKLTQLNNIKHLNINLKNASFGDLKIKNLSKITSSKNICISAFLKHALSSAKKSITEKLLISKSVSYTGRFDVSKPDLKYKGNLLKENYSVIRNVQLA